MSKKEKAMVLFKAGANCSQAVVGAFAEECGITIEEAMKLASGFGAGMGRMREVCGAVSGMVIVANLLYGSADLQDKKAKDEHYAFIRVINSVDFDVLQENPYLKTAKSDERNHGFGIHTMKTITKKYGGEIIFQQYENEFECKVVLPQKKLMQS